MSSVIILPHNISLYKYPYHISAHDSDSLACMGACLPSLQAAAQSTLWVCPDTTEGAGGLWRNYLTCLSPHCVYVLLRWLVTGITDTPLQTLPDALSADVDVVGSGLAPSGTVPSLPTLMTRSCTLYTQRLLM